MNGTSTDADARRFAMNIDIPAGPDRVWEALTDARELTRWFPLQAEVEPGPGGTMKWMWDSAWTWVSRIDRWEPGHRLTLSQESVRPFDAEGRPLGPGAAEPCTLVLDFTLEAHGGATKLRVVHSGFGRGSAWDDELDGVSVGWRFELRSLANYLARHAGRDRVGRLATVTAAVSQDDAWTRLRSDPGFKFDSWPPVQGQSLAIDLGDGHRVEGTVDFLVPNRDLALVVPALGDGTFRIGTHRSGGRTGVTVWIGSHRMPAAAVDPLRDQAARVLDRVF